MSQKTRKKSPGDSPVLARNRQASHEFQLIETFEAGMELMGSEVKALRAGRANLREGYVRIERGEAWLLGANIGEYAYANREGHVPDRRRRLLLHKREIEYLEAKVRQEGLTLIPLELYIKRNHMKLSFALARGKKLWDKRRAIAERDARREADRAMARARRA
ncbi:MAG TPA: SsrA-binding protein SmpB [Candidatus Sulfotelmatobacter sp.]|nr:SsrA-binding protein SmpB [Candidatus Sulfotelmatobacter sp.]